MTRKTFERGEAVEYRRTPSSPIWIESAAILRSELELPCLFGGYRSPWKA